MLIISAGMQKSGSGYIYNIINDLLIESGKQDARQIKKTYKLDDVMKWDNNNIGKLKNSKLIKLLFISIKTGPFVVKTHEGPATLTRFLQKANLIKSIYIYRDPRDVLISAIDHGKKILEEGETHTFAKMVNYEDALRILKEWCATYTMYCKEKGILLIKYEDLVASPHNTIEKVQNYLQISISKAKVSQIIDRYNKNRTTSDNQILHFNKGIINRYKNELPPYVIESLNKELEGTLKSMNYLVN